MRSQHWSSSNAGGGVVSQWPWLELFFWVAVSQGVTGRAQTLRCSNGSVHSLVTWASFA